MKLTGKYQAGNWASNYGASIDVSISQRMKKWCRDNKVTQRSAFEVALTEFLDKREGKGTSPE